MADGKDGGGKPPPAAPAKPAGGTTGMGGPPERPRPPMQTFTRVQSNDSDPFARRRGPITGGPKSTPVPPAKKPRGT